jgi:hypothetical protein
VINKMDTFATATTAAAAANDADDSKNKPTNITPI